MTTLYVFHSWIEPSSTSATVLLAFGGWWDADTPAGGATPPIAAFARNANSFMGIA